VRHPARLAWSLWAVTAAFAVCAVVLGAMNGYTDFESVLIFVVAWFTIQAFATVGAVVASRLPANAVGWILCAAPVFLMGANVVSGYVELAHDRHLPGGIAVATASEWTWIVGLSLVLAFVPLLFPDGRPASRRWGVFVRAAAVWLAAVAVAVTFAPGPLTEPFDKVDNPVGVPGMKVVEGILLVGGTPVVLLLSALSVVYRYRRSAGEQRQQLKWFAAALLGTAAFVLLNALADALAGVSAPDALFLAVIATIPISIGIAILRHRLYDIDVVINRTLVYGGLTATLAAAYLGSVLLLQLVLRPVTEKSDLAIAGSTLAVAALVGPARRRIQELVDRRFYRRKYDAQRTLEDFSARLREEVDLDSLGDELRRVLGETMQPAHVSLWLRAPEAGR
jgi:hypothetical protein